MMLHWIATLYGAEPVLIDRQIDATTVEVRYIREDAESFKVQVSALHKTEADAMREADDLYALAAAKAADCNASPDEE